MAKEKEQKLRGSIASMEKVLVAFSGGVDSTYLLHIAREVLGPKNVLAVIAQTPTYPKVEIVEAIRIADGMEIKCRLIETEEFQDENFVSNPADRCYYCKKELFAKLKELADENGIGYVLDGSNVNDFSDVRPGSRAKQEFGVRSPLQEVDLSKAEIRELSKEAGLPTWDKPSMACLSSRIPYGTRITKDVLVRIDEAEKFIRSLGLKQVRVRHHDVMARIEVEPEEIVMMLHDSVREKITKKLEQLGYFFVTVDLKGYRTGSLNEPMIGENSGQID